MENNIKLSFIEKMTLPFSKGYKNFKYEIENTPIEQFYMDGERQFSDLEKKYMKLYQKELNTNKTNHNTEELVNKTNANDEFKFRFRENKKDVERVPNKNILKSVSVITLSVEDLQERGYDTKNLTQNDLENIAYKMDLSEEFWNELETRAENYGLTRKQEKQDVNWELSDFQAVLQKPNNEKEKVFEKYLKLMIYEKSLLIDIEHTRSITQRENRNEEEKNKLSNLWKSLENTEKDIKKEVKLLAENGIPTDDIYKIRDVNWELHNIKEEYKIELSRYKQLENKKDVNNQLGKLYGSLLDKTKLIDKLNNSKESIIDSIKNLPKKEDLVKIDLLPIEEVKQLEEQDFENYIDKISDEKIYLKGLIDKPHTPNITREQVVLLNNITAHLEDITKEIYHKNYNEVERKFEIKPIQKIKNFDKKEFQMYFSNLMDRYLELGQRSVDSNVEEYGLTPLSEQEVKELSQINKQINYINNTDMERKFELEKHLQNQMKYLGFGESEKLHNDLKQGITRNEKEFVIKTTSDKTLPINKIEFGINFKKSDKGGVFLNSYDATLTNDKGETLSHRFKVKKEDNITAKESINLLEGRVVKTAFVNVNTNEKEPTFIKLKLNEEKNQYGNFNLDFYKGKDIDVAKIIDNSNLIFDKPEYKEYTIKSLEKGNLAPVKFKHENTEIEGKASLNPQYKTLNLYDKDMNRVNTNKPIKGLEVEQNEKANTRQHNSKRSL